MEHHYPSTRFFALLATGWCLLSLLIVLTESHFPGTDVFVFKEAGVNLATKGKFVAARLPFMEQGEEKFFAYYPPVFPFLFGVWTKCWGVGLKQSLAFNCLLRILRTLLLVLLVWPHISYYVLEKKGKVLRGLLLALFWSLSLTTTDPDRPDELALIWGLSLLWILTRHLSEKQKIFWGGIFLGLTAATSPACAILFAMVVIGWAVTKREWKVLLGTGISSAVVFLMCILPILIAYRGVPSQFQAQSHASSHPYPLPFIESSFSNSVSIFWGLVKTYFSHGWRYALYFSFLMVGVLALRKKITKPKYLQEPLSYLAITSVIFAVLALFVWTFQPYYLWFSSVLLTGALLLSTSQYGQRQLKRAISLTLLALVPFLLREAQGILNAIELPPTEKPSFIRDKVLADIGPFSRLAVSYDQYYTFRKNREIANVTYSCRNLEDFDYIYVTSISNSKISRPTHSPIHCFQKDVCFEVFREYASNKKLSLFGKETPYFLRGNGGTLYKRCDIATTK